MVKGVVVVRGKVGNGRRRREHVFGSPGYLPGVEWHAPACLASPAATPRTHAPLLLACPHLPGMFHALANYLHERRRGFSKAVGVVGGAYMVGRYVSARLEDMRVSILQERASREKCVLSTYFLRL